MWNSGLDESHTSWNQDCQERYQQPQICRWQHPNGRKQRGTKEPLDEGERGKWKSQLKTQHSKKWRSWHTVPSLQRQMGKKQKQWQILFSWAPKSLWTARRSNQSILKEINPDYSLKTNAEAEAPLLWPPDMTSWLTGKDPDAGNDWEQEKGARENEMVGWYHSINGHKFEQILGDSAVHGVPKS